MDDLIAWSNDEEDQAEDLARSMIAQHFPDLYQFKTSCPQCLETRPLSIWSDGKSSLFSLMIHLNDGHKWDREKIADFLEGLDIDLTFQVPVEYPL